MIFIVTVQKGGFLLAGGSVKLFTIGTSMFIKQLCHIPANSKHSEM